MCHPGVREPATEGPNGRSSCTGLQCPEHMLSFVAQPDEPARLSSKEPVPAQLTNVAVKYEPEVGWQRQNAARLVLVWP